MTYEGVTFVDDAVRSLSKKDFISLHENVFWLDRERDTRKKLLSDVYGKIVGNDSGKSDSEE